MALEPITRQEQIIAGKDLEPITRMERFLKEYGGGGSAEQMDIVLHVNATPGSMNIPASNVEIAEGSMEAVRTAVAEGRVPKGKIVFDSSTYADEYGVYGWVSECTPAFYLYGGYIYMSCIAVDGLYASARKWKFMFSEDGTIEMVTQVE